MKGLLELFFIFFRIGCTTFGGGYAILPVLDRELIQHKGWVSMEEVMNYYTIGQVTPGIIAVNVSTFIGYKQKGAVGGFIATLGFISPSLILIILAALFLQNFAHIPLAQHAFRGIRVAVSALIAHTIIKLIKGFYKDMKALAIFSAALVLSAVFSASPVLLVSAAGVAGFLLYRPKNSGPADTPKPDAPC